MEQAIATVESAGATPASAAPLALVARALDALTSLKFTIVCLILLMVLWWPARWRRSTSARSAPSTRTSAASSCGVASPEPRPPSPSSPGAGLIGLLLTANLAAAQLKRLERSRRKIGIWVVHAGLILLFAGEFVTALFQVEMQMAIEQGQTLDFLESPRDMELALVDVTDPRRDDVHSIPESLLAQAGLVEVPGTPVVLDVKLFFRNAELTLREPGDPDPIASRGEGANIVVKPLPPVSKDDQVDRRAAFIEPIAGGRKYGVWLVSNAFGAPQHFIHEGRSYALSMRPLREYLPYAITLKKFSHDVYPGTDIPKNFSSLVHLANPSRGEERDVLIFMNQPLRYAGKTFYQASFGKGDTLSVLQVVKNPGWLLPYISCVLVALGLILHFAVSLGRALRKRTLPVEAR